MPIFVAQNCKHISAAIISKQKERKKKNDNVSTGANAKTLPL